MFDKHLEGIKYFYNLTLLVNRFKRKIKFVLKITKMLIDYLILNLMVKKYKINFEFELDLKFDSFDPTSFYFQSFLEYFLKNFSKCQTHFQFLNQ